VRRVDIGGKDGQNIVVMSRKVARKSAGGPPNAVAAAEFKAHCLELMDRVRETGAEYVVTKHGEPVAKLVPYVAPAPRKFFGALKGTVLKYDRPFDPIDAEWDISKT
jgi:prevent-host-death family protein